MKIGVSIFLKVVFLILSNFCLAQNDSINWLSFEKLETKFITEPKKVIIHFYTDWCIYCKKMEKEVYTKPKVIERVNKNYYAVKFDAESTDTIFFGGKTFKNLNIDKKRNPNHELAEYLATQSERGVVLPATIIFDKNFNIEQKIFSYLSPKGLIKVLKP